MEWNGMEWNGMEWNGMEWNGMEWYVCMYVCMYVCVKIKYIHVWSCMYNVNLKYTHTLTHTYIYIHTYIHIVQCSSNFQVNRQQVMFHDSWVLQLAKDNADDADPGPRPAPCPAPWAQEFSAQKSRPFRAVWEAFRLKTFLRTLDI